MNFLIVCAQLGRLPCSLFSLLLAAALLCLSRFSRTPKIWPHLCASNFLGQALIICQNKIKKYLLGLYLCLKAKLGRKYLLGSAKNSRILAQIWRAEQKKESERLDHKAIRSKESCGVTESYKNKKDYGRTLPIKRPLEASDGFALGLLHGT